ncbi:MAG: DUF6318 family protein [Arthrobacter sp.]
MKHEQSQSGSRKLDTRRTAVALASVLAAALLISGCSQISFVPATQTAEAQAPKASDQPVESPTPTPSPYYSQASGAGPAANVELPVLPEAARQDTKEGLLAFAEYWFELVDYTYQTGDSEPLREVTTPECGVCGGMFGRIPETYASGGWVEGGLVEMEKLDSAFVLTPENRRQATMSVRQKVLVFRDSTGKSVDVVAGGLRAKHMLLEATFTGDGWYVDTAEFTGWPG